ncbi:MAG: PD40 domain-containing protein [Polyangiaceae bacterium]|nr:PD40 domain-containing protein [Polyangiaceae bacterium]
MNRAAKLLLASVLVAFAVLSGASHAFAGDPYIDWYTIETPRYHIHYHGGLERHAQRLANLTEAIGERLEREMRWHPQHVTHVIITDDTDDANGSATVRPHELVRLYATAPDDMSALGDYDEWLSLLFTHENSHILHIGNTTGLPAVLNVLLGRTYTPNQIQPKWIIEGWAVYLETKFTSGGRLRSSLFDMYLRTDALEGRILPIDQISSDPRRWPGGTVWYLYGGKFIEWISNTFGEDTMPAVSAYYGRHILAWGINRAIRHASGRTYPELWKGWIRHVEREAAATSAAVRSRGLREGTRLTFLGRGVASPRWVPLAGRRGLAEEILFFADDGDHPAGLYRLALAGRDQAAGKPQLVARAINPTAAFGPEGDLVYSTTAPSARHYFFSDLMRVRRGLQAPRGTESSLERLTIGRRAREPDMSPDGRHVVYTTNRTGTTTLRIADFDATNALTNERALVPSARFEQVFTPRFSPDGRHVAYSVWTEGGYRDIRVVEVGTGRFFELFHDRAAEQQPTWTPDGRMLLFASDRSGIPNIYAFDLATRHLWQVTNVLTGAYMPEVSDDGKTLFYAGYTSRGFDIYSLPLDRTRFLPALPYVDRRPSPQPQPELARWPVRPYRPIETLRPRAYTLSIGPGTFGNALLLTTTGNDAAGLHAVSGAISVDDEEGLTNGVLDYAYAGLPVVWRARFSRRKAPRQDYAYGDSRRRFVEVSTGITTGLTYSLPRAFDAQELALSYSAQFLEADLPVGTVADPYATVTQDPYRGFFALLHAGYSYSNVTRQLYSIGGERGFAASLGGDLAGDATGSESSLVAISGRVRDYLPLPWGRHHVLALAFSGGASGGDYARRGLYYTGGFVDVPFLDAFRDGVSAGAFVLRGYEPTQFVGSRFLLANAEYRAPIVYLDRGISTLPVFLRSISAAAFADYGGAFAELDRDHPLDALQLGLGGELWFDVTIGYIANANLRVGYARGTDSSAIHGGQKYVVVASGF